MTRPGEPAPCLQAEIGVPTAARMRALGRWLAPMLRPGDLIVLNGPLGAGKTTLVQGIGEGLHVRGPVTSPTFVIARVHPALRGGPALVHVDAYRLSSPAEVDDLDLDADLERSVTVVEWGGGLVEELAPSWLDVTIAAPGLPVPGPAVPGPAVPGPAVPGLPVPVPRPAVPVPGLPAGQVPASMPGAVGETGPDGEPGEGDEPRTVLLTGRGERWAPAAEYLRAGPAASPPASTPGHLALADDQAFGASGVAGRRG
jgi:tRNA threonylcarbamoyl adenosine modification protein YjeE